MREMRGHNEASILTLQREEIEKGLIFLGIAGIYDPPRAESSAAVKECRMAGISVHMLTGDHLSTAVAIAKEIGIIPKGQNEKTIGSGFYAMKALDFDNIPDDEIDKMERLPSVIARCSPTTKVKMVDALKRRKKVVAMTGDGTNDAPSLKKANVGIAMGMNGSDVAKQASDIVLTGRNYPLRGISCRR
jgi:magnesium-transporting ATPase (P-type)